MHYLTSSIRPKTGNTFVGEYGAILDGSGWTTADDTQAAFRAHNEDIDYVTIRNLVIRNMPFSGIHAFYWMSDHWTIEYNEIASNKMGLEVAPNFTIRNNYIHHNVGNTSSSNPAERGGGYQVVRADNTTFDSNEIAYNGPEQKVGQSANVTFRNNFVHHNVYAGIWYDTNTNGGTLIEGNRVEDNGHIGIALESSIGATIRNNTVRRHSASEGVFISMSQNAQIYGNTLEANFGGIAYFLNCDSLSLGEDVKNNAAYDNTVVVGTQTYAYASGFSYRLLVHLNTARAISEWFEEPDLLPQRVPRAITLLRSVLSLARLEVLDSVAGTGAGCRRQPVPVAAEAGAFCRRVRRTQRTRRSRSSCILVEGSSSAKPSAFYMSRWLRRNPAPHNHILRRSITASRRSLPRTPAPHQVFPHIRRCHCGVSVGTCI